LEGNILTVLVIRRKTLKELITELKIPYKRYSRTKDRIFIELEDEIEPERLSLLQERILKQGFVIEKVESNSIKRKYLW